MRKYSTILFASVVAMTVSGCSIFGNTGVESAPYNVLRTDSLIEIRQYETLVMASTPMNGDMDNDKGAFKKLFRYISGENESADKIEMTAPVLLNEEETDGQKISMTAPVLMDQDETTNNWTMSFVLPADFNYETAPRPTDPDVTLVEITDLTVAAIRFNGFLNKNNAQKYKRQLEQWIADNDYTITGPYKTAGYNPPWTLPNMRRNEVIIPVKRK